MSKKVKYLKRTGIFLLITGTLLFLYRPTINTTTFNILGSFMLCVGGSLCWHSRQYAAKAVAKRIIKWTGIFFIITGTPLYVYRSTALKINTLGAVMLLVGAFLYWRSRQYAAEAVAKRIISDSKPDVLYLRGFGTAHLFRRRLWVFFLVG
jgi:hypothetical protein